MLNNLQELKKEYNEVIERQEKAMGILNGEDSKTWSIAKLERLIGIYQEMDVRRVAILNYIRLTETTSAEQIVRGF